MKKNYVSPVLYRYATVLSQIITASLPFDGKYGYENEGFLPNDGGGDELYTTTGQIGWRDDDEVDPDETYAKSYQFGSLWD